MVVDMSYFRKVLKNILILLFSLIFIYFSFKLAIFYIPFLIGFIISQIIEPIIKLVSKKTKLSRKTSAVIVLILIFTLLIGLIIWGIVNLVTETTNLLQGVNNYVEQAYTKIQGYIENIKINIPENIINILNDSAGKIIDFLSKYTTEILTKFMQGLTSIPIAIIYVVITILSTYFIVSDKIYILDQIEHHFPKSWFKKICMKIKKILNALGNYFKAQGTLVLISFIEVLIGLYIIKWIGLNVSYPLLSALGIAFVDALPILGSGTVIIPWAIISSINGDIHLAIALIILFVIITVVRQILEPKIVSNKIGVHPIFTLIAMYTGFKTIGIIGLFIGPIVLIILQNVFETIIDNGIVKTILDKN